MDDDKHHARADIGMNPELRIDRTDLLVFNDGKRRSDVRGGGLRNEQQRRKQKE
jgi:hypothetical protein